MTTTKKRQSIVVTDISSGNLDFIDIVFYATRDEMFDSLTHEFFYQGRRLIPTEKDGEQFLEDKVSGVVFEKPDIDLPRA